MLHKIQFFQNTVAQNTGTFVAQNTDFSRNCCAKYRIGYCANYNLAKKMFRKIQKLKTDIPQITGFSKKVCAFYSFCEIQ